MNGGSLHPKVWLFENSASDPVVIQVKLETKTIEELMRRMEILLLITTLMLTISGCAVSLSVLTDSDEDADFSDYRTYYWSDDFQRENGAEEPLFYNSLIQKRLKSAIAREMEARGYEQDAENPDLLVDSRVIVEQRNDLNTYAYSPYYYWWYYPGPYQTSSQRKEGGVIIELIDPERAQLVWQGYAPDVLRQEEKDKQQEIRDAVSMIFSKYDHRAGS